MKHTESEIEKYMESLYDSDLTKPVRVRKASKTKTLKAGSNKAMHDV